jgi:hypothetical protein
VDRQVKQECVTGANGAPLSVDPADLDWLLPPREIFPATMPRYPNLWFLVDDRLAIRNRYEYAVEFVVKALEHQLGMNDDFLTGIRNHIAYHWLSPAAEGSDFQMRLGPFHPYTHPERVDYSHRHQVHARFYLTSLVESSRYSLQLPDQLDRRYLALAASVHYEVATEDLPHPCVDSCPMCGTTGDYDVHIEPGSQDYCIKIHDPLGLEFLLHGTVRGETFPEDSRRPCSSLAEISNTSHNSQWALIEISPERLEPVKLGCAIVSPRS